MHAVGFLELWLQCHGAEHPLTPELRQQFLLRSEVTHIVEFPDSDIRACTLTNTKLKDILACLEVLPVDVGPPARTPLAPSERMKPQPAPMPSTGSGGRSRKAGSVWQEPVNPEEAKAATVDFDRQHREYP